MPDLVSHIFFARSELISLDLENHVLIDFESFIKKKR